MRYPTDAATRSLAVLIFFTVLSGGFWQNLIGVWGYLALAVAITVSAAVLLTRRRLWSRLDLRRLPRTFLLVGVVAVVSIAWSAAPGATALTLLVQGAVTLAALFLCAALTWPRLVAALGTALCWILGLSVAFELIAAMFVRASVSPFWTGSTSDAALTPWTQAALFTGGPVQGIVADSGLLAFVAALSLIVLGVQLSQRLRRRIPTLVWIGIAVALLALTRSLVALAALAVAAAMLGALLLARRVGPGRRVGVMASIAVVTAVAVVVILVVASGLQSHNVWLDVWAQTGVVGVFLAAALVVGTWHRLWWFAVDDPLDSLGLPIRRVPLTLAPALVFTALLVQTFFDSAMLAHAGWLLLVVFAVKSKLDQTAVSLDLANGDERVNPLPARSLRALQPYYVVKGR